MVNAPALGRDQIKFEDCAFYHTVELPGIGIVKGEWDLRGHVDEYLGFYSFSRKRVLEIGPASGFLTFEMEQRGANVVALEVQDDPGWDFVPFPDDVLHPIFPSRRKHMAAVKNSFWFLHRLNNSKAKLYYGDSCGIPDDLGHFDAAIMASVLLHCERPARILAECAKHADTLIVTDLYCAELEGQAVCRLRPTVDNKSWDTWWDFSTDFFLQYFGVLGFPHVSITRHKQFCAASSKTLPLFTAIGSKNEFAGSTKYIPPRHRFLRNFYARIHKKIIGF